MVLSRASFRQLLLFAFVGIAVLLGAVSLSGLQVLQGLMAQSREAAAEAVRLNNTTRGLAERATDMERSSRQFLVLGDQALRRRFDDAADEAQRLMQPLTERDETEVTANAWLAALTRVRTQIADERIAVMAREQSIAEEFRELSRLTGVLTAQVQQGITDRNRALQDELELRRSQLARQVLVAIVLAALAALGFGVWLTRPIRQLKEAIVALGENRADPKLEIGGPSDLRSLGLQLDWLRLRLTELEADKARFLRHISHELKTPLAAVREGASLLEEGVGGELNPSQREIVEILGQNTTLLQKQIEDLLNFNAAAFDARQLQRVSTDLLDLVREVVEGQRLQWQARHVKVTVEGSSVRMPVDPAKLGMALGNLMSNAIRFSPPQSTVRWQVGTEGSDAVLTVQDAGPGIAAADQARIFEPFFRGSVQPEGHVRGSGVGLSIVQEIVAGHGGKVALLPAEQGACFRIQLPLGTSDV